MASDSADLLDVDLRSFVDHLRATKPPYECPYISCGKIYKSYNGIHSHLLTHGASPELFVSGIGGETGEGSGAARDAGANSNAKYVQSSPSSREHLTYSQAQKFVDVEINGKTTRLSIVEPLEVITCLDDNLPPAKKSPVSPGRHKEVKPPGSPKGKPPEPSFRIVDDCPQSGKFELPKHYIRYIEKSSEEQNEDVEYDMDEEDHAWLKIMNDRRHARKHTKIDEDTFELVMDRLEKFCHFQNQDAGPFIDDDAVCCVCNDGECENSNVILFCDMCNLAVHQDCYGVPYIPEGEWLCRRCQLSPSKAVDCCLCPNKGGAFKQTSDGRWAHVVCGLWVPEVQFANVVFLEPMEGFERIPPARWKLSCFICKQRGVGACIQCHKPNCYTAFHVTCAQSAGLYMHMEPINDNASNSTTVRKTICCDVHAPNAGSIVNSNGTNNYKRINELKEMSKKKLKKVRRMLIERRTVMPTVSIPVIPSQCLESIEEEAKIPNGEKDFLQRIVAFWTLKRKARFGVPLLRRLQVYHHKKSLPEFENSDELSVQLKHFRRLRADLEKVRLLCELTRKREKRKQEQLDISFRLVDLRLRPFALMLVDVIDKIQAHDKHRVFAEPVSDATVYSYWKLLSSIAGIDVAGYSKVITSPMDLGTMRTKALTLQYTKLEEVEADFTLMLQNCMKFNPKDTYHYRFAQSFRKWGHLYLNEARKILPSYDLESGLHAVDVPGVNLELSVCNALSSLHFFDSTKREDDMLSDELNFSGAFDHDEAEEDDKAITMEQLLAEAQMSSKQASAIERKLKKQAVPSSRKSKQSKQTLHSSSASASRTQPDPAELCLPSSSSANVSTPTMTQQRRRRGSVRGDVSIADQELPKKRLRKDGDCILYRHDYELSKRQIEAVDLREEEENETKHLRRVMFVDHSSHGYCGIPSCSTVKRASVSAATSTSTSASCSLRHRCVSDLHLAPASSKHQNRNDRRNHSFAPSTSMSASSGCFHASTRRLSALKSMLLGFLGSSKHIAGNGSSARAATFFDASSSSANAAQRVENPYSPEKSKPGKLNLQNFSNVSDVVHKITPRDRSKTGGSQLQISVATEGSTETTSVASKTSPAPLATPENIEIGPDAVSYNQQAPLGQRRGKAAEIIIIEPQREKEKEPSRMAGMGRKPTPHKRTRRKDIPSVKDRIQELNRTLQQKSGATANCLSTPPQPSPPPTGQSGGPFRSRLFSAREKETPREVIQPEAFWHKPKKSFRSVSSDSLDFLQQRPTQNGSSPEGAFVYSNNSNIVRATATSKVGKSHRYTKNKQIVPTSIPMSNHISPSKHSELSPTQLASSNAGVRSPSAFMHKVTGSFRFGKFSHHLNGSKSVPQSPCLSSRPLARGDNAAEENGLASPTPKSNGWSNGGLTLKPTSSPVTSPPLRAVHLSRGRTVAISPPFCVSPPSSSSTGGRDSSFEPDESGSPRDWLGAALHGSGGGYFSKSPRKEDKAKEKDLRKVSRETKKSLSEKSSGLLAPSKQRKKSSKELGDGAGGNPKSLHEHSKNAPFGLVPLFVRKCVEFVETEGLTTEGIYRVPGNQVHVATLEQKFAEDPNISFRDLDIPVNAVATALKNFFATLSEPVIPGSVYEDLMQAMSCSDKTIRLKEIRGILRTLPPENIEVLKYFLIHLRKVASHAHETSMDHRNLAKCWWPTLLRPHFDTFETMAQMTQKLEEFLQLLLDQYEYMFLNGELQVTTNSVPTTKIVKRP